MIALNAIDLELEKKFSYSFNRLKMGHITFNTNLELSTFKWPNPPYLKVVHSADKPLLESCIIDLLDKNTVTGKLIRFSPEEARVLIHPFNSKEHQIIAFNEIKNLQILSPASIVAEQNFLASRAQEAFSPSEKQAYHIDFIDGTSVAGETSGYVYNEAGLYIFPVLKDSMIEKHFIPSFSIKDYQIGMPIGDILIEEKHATSTDIETALDHQKELRSKRIGDYLNEHQIISAEQLHQAITHQESRPVLKLGEALKELELLNDAQLEEALKKQKENRNLRLGQILINMGIVDERTLKGTLAKKLGIPYVDLVKFNFDPNAIRLISRSLAQKYTLMPLCMHDGMLVIAFEDPMNYKAIDEIRFVTQMNVLPAMAAREDILQAIDEYYASAADWYHEESSHAVKNDDGSIEFNLADLSTGDDLANRLFEEDKSSHKEVDDEPIAESDNTLVQLVNKMIMDAVKEKVSDIHIETYPDKKNTIVRFRKDGTLLPYIEIPANFRNALVSRIKIMCQLDISERRKPQDGKLDFQQFGPKKVELRVATIPTSNGMEDIVMRVLSSSKPLAIKQLGLSEDALNSLQNMIVKPHGLILVCGPTGSGKTTTLHSLLGHINTSERKIWTAEDPIEITQVGLRQVQVNAKIGWTFANAMRSFLRADPDVIMVGEMRDEETTKTGIEASLTGHLVLSTLHTNSAPESIVRMLDMGMDPFNFADALVGILAQRLAKALCPHCKESYEPEQAEIEALADEYVLNTNLSASTVLEQWQAKHQPFVLHKVKGCKACNNTGYKGRVGLYELMTVTPSLRHLIQKRSPVSEITDDAIANGMKTLKQDGIMKVLQGETDITQVRVVSA
jgi:type II secretory ATPase GspE/PulE/Tfp pilus assembly ATPase PilB-like protein